MKDINKPKRSLRDIFPESSANNSDNSGDIVTNYYPTTHPQEIDRQGLKFSGWPLKTLAGIVGLLVIVGVGYGLSQQFAKVVVKVTPKQGRLLVSNVYSAARDNQDGLKFVLASNLQDEASTVVKASGKETVQTKAQGKITIYNNYSVKPQILVATTRFQSTNGLIYRTPKSISIPGMTKNNTGQTVPGQIEVIVVADKAGADYNIAPTDFNIPGFKGSPKATKIYAKAKTAMTGGFVGEQGKISNEDKAKAELELKKILNTKIVQKLKPQVPEDYILFDDAVVMNYTENIISDPKTPDQAKLKLVANATGVLFNKNELSKFLAAQQVPDYQGETVTITNWSQMKFTLENKDNLNINNLDQISFKLEGNGHLVWSFDEKSLKDKLRLANSGNYKDIFDKNFPTVQMATVVFSPPWVRTIPADESKIKVETNIAQ